MQVRCNMKNTIKTVTTKYTRQLNESHFQVSLIASAYFKNNKNRW